MNEYLQKRRNENVILVDDDPDDRDLFAEAMNMVDPRVHVTMKRDGEELANYLSQESDIPDLIFLDLNMPKKNGRECLADLQKNPRFKSVPVIIYTTSLNPVDIEETFKNGASRFFRKPNSFEELKEILNSILFSELTLSGPRGKEDFVLSTKASTQR